jgi:hypothetical protein
LDHVTPYDIVVAVAIVLLIGDEVCLLEQLLLMMLEFSDHGAGICT